MVINKRAILCRKIFPLNPSKTQNAFKKSFLFAAYPKTTFKCLLKSTIDEKLSENNLFAISYSNYDKNEFFESYFNLEMRKSV